MDTFRISKDAIDDIIEYKADDSTYFDLAKKKAYLYGNANVIYDGLNLKAYLIIVDFETRQLYAKGRIDSNGKYVDRPIFNDGERETMADTMIYNFNSKRGRTYGISMKEDEGFIYCNKVFRDNDKSIYSDRGRYTTCNNIEHPHFYLSTSNLKIIPEKKIIFGPSNLVIEDIPTPLVLPFGMVPTNKKKKSGLLPFEYGNSANYGPFLRNLGFHLGISNKFDQSFTGDAYFRGSWRVASNSRYAVRYKYTGNLKIEFARYQNGEREDPNFKSNREKTAKFEWNHMQDPKARPGSSFSAKMNIQKGNAAQLNSFNPTAIISNEFQSSVSYSKFLLKNKLELRTSATHSQNTQTHDFSMVLPSLTLSLQRITPFTKPSPSGKSKWYKDFAFSYNFDIENRIRTKDSIFFTGKPLEGFIPGFSVNNPMVLLENDKFQQGIIHNLPITLGSYKFFKQYFTFSPSVTYREFWYFKTIEKYWDPSDSTVKINYKDGFARANDYSAAATLSTNIFGTYQLSSKKVKAIRHSINPIVSYSYRPDYSSEKFGYYKSVQVNDTGLMGKYSIFERGIKGGPATGKSGLLNFNIINNLQAKVLKKTDTSQSYENKTWIENFNVSGSYNTLLDTMKLSNLNVGAFTKLFNLVNINAGATLNPYQKRGNEYFNKFQLLKDGRVGTWTNASIQMNTSLNADMFRKKKSLDTAGKVRSQEDEDDFNAIRYNPAGYVNFDLPWSANINYSLYYDRSNYRTTITQTFGVGGDFNLSPKWKIGANTGYDFLQKKISYTQFEISRTLHCWALSMTWIPDGIRKSFMFSLKANSSILQSLKVDKRRNWYDQ